MGQDKTNQIKSFIKKYSFLFFALCLLWASISNLIQSFKCPQLTQTEQFLRLHKSFIADYINCEAR